LTPDFFPPDRYYCLLDEQPDYLIPPRLLRGREGYGPLMINPQCWFAWQGPAPPDIAARAGPIDRFYDTPWIVWVDDPATRGLTPFWLGPELAHVLYQLTPGQLLPGGLSDELRNLLWTAQIVVTPDHAARRRRQWMEAARWYCAQFPRGFVALDDLIHPFHLGALRRYYRHQTRTGRLQLGDDQAAWRYVAHNEPVARFFHQQLTYLISDVSGALVTPSYSYVTLYQGGANLDPHTDREQCEYTLSLCFDATPEPPAQVPWPVNLLTAEGALSVRQHLGDGLLFRGRYLTHWRDRLADDQTSSSILFHYVDAGFQGVYS
jgi:hypothetical protein